MVLVFLLVQLLVISEAYGLMGSKIPSRKTWWAKHVTEDVYTAGWLTEDQLKFAAEAGFESILSMFTTDNGPIGDELLPAYEREKDIVTRLSGKEFEVILKPGESWKNLDTVHRFGEAYLRLPKPILFHCHSAYSASFITLLYFANQTRYNPDSTPIIDKAMFYEKAGVLGYDFYAQENLRRLVVEVTGVDDVTLPPTKPDTTLPNWSKNSWLVKPLYKNWFIAGQIQSNHIPNLEKSGFKRVINTRKGVIIPPNMPSQEEVILLNIRDRTGTYTGSGRQTKERLESNRIDPDKPNEYISINSSVNYHSRNPLQFGDHIGYNETMEQEYIGKSTIEYFHTPVGGEYTYGMPLWEAYKHIWQEVGKDNTPVVHHCRIGFRATATALLAAGYQYGKSSEWALKRARMMGYRIEEERDSALIELYRTVLDSNPVLYNNAIRLDSLISWNLWLILLHGFIYKCMSTQ